MFWKAVEEVEKPVTGKVTSEDFPLTACVSVMTLQFTIFSFEELDLLSRTLSSDLLNA